MIKMPEPKRSDAMQCDLQLPLWPAVLNSEQHLYGTIYTTLGGRQGIAG